MRIAELHLFKKELPIVGGPYTMSTITLHSVESTIVKLVSDTGIVGWGEVAPIGSVYQPQHATGARAAIGVMAPGLIGESALTPLLLRRRMDGLLNGHNYAKAAIDVAIMDLLGKHYGVRVCELLGGAAAERLPAYYATGIGEPDAVAELAMEKVREGYPRIQIKAGGRDDGESSKEALPRVQRYPFFPRAAVQHDGGDRCHPQPNTAPHLARRKHGIFKRYFACNFTRRLRRIRSQANATRRSQCTRHDSRHLRCAFNAAHVRR